MLYLNSQSILCNLQSKCVNATKNVLNNLIKDIGFDQTCWKLYINLLYLSNTYHSIGAYGVKILNGVMFNLNRNSHVQE